MITIKEWMELVDYKITEGSTYGWQCYGPNAYCLDSWNGVYDDGGYSFSTIFNTKNQKVYEVTVCDNTNNRAYRMINPDYIKKQGKEAKARDVNPNEAWSEVDYVDLEVDDDFIQKCLAIKAGEYYSTDITVPIELDNDSILQAALAAHERGITLNAYINMALADLVEKVKSGEINKDYVNDFKKSK